MRTTAARGRGPLLAGTAAPGRGPLHLHGGSQQRGLILPIVLVVIGLLAVTMAGYSFFIRAESAGLAAHAEQQQARLAADSALEELIATLRVSRHDPAAWFDVPQRFRHGLVWSARFTRENDPVRQAGSRKELLAAGNVAQAWRYALCAALPDTNLHTFRYGVTPESGKLNLNLATQAQLLALFTKVLPPLGIDNALSLVEALVDWRDQDSDALANGGENEWYNRLTPAYNAKNAPLDTLEELLLVRHFNAIALWGEDVNRNGLLDPNEDDGEASWPGYDNADGVLNPGIAQYLTIWSREPDTNLENKPRANLRNGAAVVAQLQLMYPDGEISAASMGFLSQLASSGFNFGQLTSPAQLYTQGYVAPPEALIPEGEGQEGEGGEDEGEPSSQPSSGPSNGPSGNPSSRPARSSTTALPAELMGSPITAEELPYIMDGLTTRDPQQLGSTGIPGLINITTASPTVLSLIPGITPEAVAGILAARATTPAEQLRTIAWPAASGAVDTATFHAIAPFITAKAYQFHVEAVGYADHTRAARRFEWVIEMIGPLAQVKYHRELTGLGIAWPVDRDSIVAK